MTRTRSRGARWVAVTVGLALGLAGCGFGSNNDSGGGKNTINLLVPSYDDGTKALWQDIIGKFEDKNPDISVNLQVESWDNINSVVQNKVQSGEAPDVLNIDAYASFANDDLLYPVKDVVSPNVLSDFQPSFAKNASIGSTMYGMPLIASARALFYNKDLLKRAGISAPPQNWAELEADAKKLSSLGGGVSGYGMPLGSEEAQAETSIFVLGNGGSWGDANTITANAPKNVEAVTFMQKLINENVTEPNPGSQDRTPLINVFEQGKIGMIMALPPTVTEIKSNYPDLNYGIAPIPTADGSPVTLGVADHLMAFKNDGSKQDAIKKFLDFFFSTSIYTKFVTTEHFLPTTKSGAQAMTGDTTLKTFLDALPSAKFYPSTNPGWPAAQGALQQQIGTIGQGADPAKVLDQVQQAAKSAK